MSLATGADALANPVIQASPRKQSIRKKQRTIKAQRPQDYALSIASWGYNNDDPSLIDVTFGAEFRTNINNMDPVGQTTLTTSIFPAGTIRRMSPTVTVNWCGAGTSIR